MRAKVLISLIIIVLAVSLVGAGTLAWFTAVTDPIANEFTAGTVEIEAGWAEGFSKLITENWNPGDCTDLGLCLTNTGSKAIYLRARFDGHWTPGNQRMLIIYKNGETQLLSLDWDSFCKGFTGDEGPIASGSLTLSRPSGFPAYFKGIFNSFSFIKNPDWLETDTPYSIWCVDSQTTITTGTHDVQIFDPYCNPDWYTEAGVATKPKWQLIPWHKLDYIINQGYLDKGYAVDDIQEAIWHFTNGSIDPVDSRYTYANISAAAKAIVDEVNANAILSADNVSFNPGTGWEQGEDGWWYYTEAIPGTFTTSDLAERTVCFNMSVCLDGLLTGNEYQGASYHFISLFEAIQASNNASVDEWGWPTP